MGIGDVLGGLLVYDAIKQWRDDREFQRLIEAEFDAAEAEYLARRRGRPADVRSLLFLERVYRSGVRPVLSVIEDEYNQPFPRHCLTRSIST